MILYNFFIFKKLNVLFKNINNPKLEILNFLLKNYLKDFYINNDKI